MEKEIWKDIPGYELKYQASNLGRIRSLDRTLFGKNHYTGEVFSRRMKGRILKPGQFSKNRHLSVVLGRNTSGTPVHQLIMLTFVGQPPDGMEVLHNNGNPTDNRLENLRYGSRTDNILDVYYQGKSWRKLYIEDVEEIKFGLSTGIKGNELARMYDVTESSISKIKTGGTFSWIK